VRELLFVIYCAYAMLLSGEINDKLHVMLFRYHFLQVLAEVRPKVTET